MSYCPATKWLNPNNRGWNPRQTVQTETIIPEWAEQNRQHVIPATKWLNPNNRGWNPRQTVQTETIIPEWAEQNRQHVIPATKWLNPNNRGWNPRQTEQTGTISPERAEQNNQYVKLPPDFIPCGIPHKKQSEDHQYNLRQWIICICRRLYS